MSIPALGVERIIGYPRALVEPLLWLALVTGGMWLMVAFDIRRGLAPGAEVPSQLPTLAAALSLVLLINGGAALVLQAQSGWASRGVAVASGLGLGISAWGLTMVSNLDPGLKHFLFWGSISTGGLLVALSLTRWRYHDTNVAKELPGSFALAVVGLLGIGAVVLIGSPTVPSTWDSPPILPVRSPAGARSCRRSPCWPGSSPPWPPSGAATGGGPPVCWPPRWSSPSSPCLPSADLRVCGGVRGSRQ